MTKIDENCHFPSFRRKPESSKSNYFWMPDQVRHDGFGTFYETVKIQIKQTINNTAIGDKKM